MAYRNLIDGSQGTFLQNYLKSANRIEGIFFYSCFRKRRYFKVLPLTINIRQKSPSRFSWRNLIERSQGTFIQSNLKICQSYFLKFLSFFSFFPYKLKMFMNRKKINAILKWTLREFILIGPLVTEEELHDVRRTKGDHNN